MAKLAERLLKLRQPLCTILMSRKTFQNAHVDSRRPCQVLLTSDKKNPKICWNFTMYAMDPCQYEPEEYLDSIALPSISIVFIMKCEMSKSFYILVSKFACIGILFTFILLDICK